MKFKISYIGDSSDGEEQADAEESYTKDNNYIAHLNSGITKTSFCYEYLFKDIGARLLHHHKISSLYFKMKGSYLIPKTNAELKIIAISLKQDIKKIDDLINHRYIIGIFISEGFKLDKKNAIDYFEHNESNIKDIISNYFPDIYKEEKYLKNLRSAISKYSGKFLLKKFDYSFLKLYSYLLDNWGEVGNLAKIFEVNPTNKLQFANEVKNLIIKGKIFDFAHFHRHNPDRNEIIEVHEKQAHYFLKKMYKDYVNIFDRTDYILKQAIENLELFNKDSQYCSASFLAKTRIYHKFMRGITKNLLMKNEGFTTKTLSFTTSVGTIIDQDEDKPSFGTLSISEIHKIFASGARTSMVYGSTSRLDGKYKVLANDLEKLDNKTNLAFWFTKILKGTETEEKGWDDLFSKEEKHLLYDLTFLLFTCEATRNVSALLTNPMFFDLVEINYYSVKDIAKKLPITMESAVPSSIKADSLFKAKYGETDGILSCVQYYDFRVNIKKPEVAQLNDRDFFLLYDWILFYKMRMKKDFTDAIKQLTPDDPIKKVQKALGQKVLIDVMDNNISIKDCGSNLIVTKDEYEAFLTINIENNLIKGVRFALEKIPASCLHELIDQWYNLDISYLAGDIELPGDFIIYG